MPYVNLEQIELTWSSRFKPRFRCIPRNLDEYTSSSSSIVSAKITAGVNLAFNKRNEKCIKFDFEVFVLIGVLKKLNEVY